MARRAEVIRLDFEAGTGNLLAEVKKQTAAVREFGAATTSSSLQANAAIRALEGNFQSNTRAVSLFLRETLHLGPALTAAFNVVGPLLFAKVLFDIGKKVHDFFKEASEAPARVAEAFRALNGPLQTTNDELRVSNDRLANEIAKLEGKRQNTLKLALDEARVAADKLADSLDEDFKKLTEFAKQESIGAFKAGILGIPSTSGFADKLKSYREIITNIQDEGAANVRNAKTEAEAKIAQQATDTRILEALTAQSEQWKVQLDAARQLQKYRALREKETYQEQVNDPRLKGAPGPYIQDQSEAINELNGYYQNTLKLLDKYGLMAKNVSLTASAEALKADKDFEKGQTPFINRLNEMIAKVAVLNGQLSEGGQGGFAKRMALALQEAAQHAARVNAEMEKIARGSSAPGAGGRLLAFQQLSLAQAGAQYRHDVSDEIDKEIRKLHEEAIAYDTVANAIGDAYEARVRAAAIAAAAKSKGYDEASTAEKRKLEAAEEVKLRSEHAEQVAGTVFALQQEVALAERLASVQSLGAAAVGRERLAEEQIQAIRAGDWQKAILLALQYDAERKKADATEIEAIKIKIAATNRLANAKGEQAKREAEIANKQAEAAFKGGGAGVVAGVGAEEAASQRAKLMEEVDKLVQDYANKIDDINRQEQAIRNAYLQDANTVRAIHDLEQDRLKIEAEYELKLRTISGGVRAFFLDMQRDSESAGQIVYTSLHSALERISDEFGKLFTGQIKGKDVGKSFGKVFQDLGGQLVSSSVKSLAQKGLGALASHIPGLSGIGIGPVLSKGNPGYVIVTNLAAAGGIGGIASILGQTHLPGLAGGGDISPGMPYIVGEHGPEIRTFSSSGSIVPMSHIGGPSVMVDARGSDLGVLNRIPHAIDAGYRAAVNSSAHAQYERSRRTPSQARR